ncbi:MAG: DUF4428 domain-containing protein [Liquorilactobacillus nagelii]|uniref:DUF4428 domain-containing protein n=1 Tax=Oenococcus sicerae TaxID=2203724 RepID=UPI0039E83834
MARSCTICGKKISLFSPALILKDGSICKDCFSKIGLTGSFSDNSWAQRQNSNELKSLIEKGDSIDTKAENATFKLSLKKSKAKVNQEVADERERNNKNYQDILSTFNNDNAQKFDKYLFDSNKQQVLKKRTLLDNEYKLISYSDIVNYTPIQRGEKIHKQHTLTRAVIGNELAGSVGAIVGAVSGGKDFEYVNKLGVIVNVKDNSTFSIYFITTKTKKGALLDMAFDNFDQICALLDGIIDSNRLNIKIGKDDPFEKIKKYKELLDNNIISQEEFEAKKKQLLNL